MSFIFPPYPLATAFVSGTTDLFPVHRIYCVGQNYAEHAKEMGATGREAPFFFMKPSDAVLPVREREVGEMPYPPLTQNLHYEIELVVAIGKAGHDISSADALSHIWGYAVGLDMTRRDLQGEAKKLGRPWSTGKGFDFSAPIGPIYPASTHRVKPGMAIHLKVNGELRQKSTISSMIWSISETIEHLSKYFTLQAGDLIFTGTPAGVGAVKAGDFLEGAIEELGELRIRIS